MQVQFMMLCQHATDVNGVVSVLNAGITNIWVQGFPTIVPITVWIQALIEKTDVGVHRYTLSIRSEDGQIVQLPQPDGKKVPIKLDMNANIQKKPGADENDPVVNATNLTAQINAYFEKPGKYEFRCDIDGKHNNCVVYVGVPKTK